MKIDIKFGKPFHANELVYHGDYIMPFTITGGTAISTEKLIQASQTPAGMKKLEQQILAELSALLQVELYGRVLSNEPEATGNQPKPDSKESETVGGANRPDNQAEATGDKRPDIGGDSDTANPKTKTRVYETKNAGGDTTCS